MTSTILHCATVPLQQHAAMQQAAIRADRERGLRIEQLTKKAGARLKNQGIMRGFTAWQFKWEERVAQKQMLA